MKDLAFVVLRVAFLRPSDSIRHTMPLHPTSHGRESESDSLATSLSCGMRSKDAVHTAGDVCRAGIREYVCPDGAELKDIQLALVNPSPSIFRPLRVDIIMLIVRSIKDTASLLEVPADRFWLQPDRPRFLLCKKFREAQ